MKAAVLLPFVLFFCIPATAADQPEATFRLSGWTYGRERKTLTGSNRVTGNLNIKNASKAPVTDVTVTITYTTGLGEAVVAPIVQKAGTLKPGDSKPLTFVAEFVPVFQSYTIAIQYNGSKKEEWFANSDTAQPEPKGAQIKGVASVMILGKEAAVQKDGTFAGTLHLKNEGTEEATNLQVFVTFFDMKKAKIKEWNGPLGTGTLAGGAEKNIPFTMPGAPKNYGSYSIRLNNDDAPAEAALAGGEFTRAEEVEFAHFKFTRAADQKAGYKVEVQCRNGLKSAVDHVKLEMLFFGPKRREIKRFTHEIPGTVAAGEIKPVAFDIPGLPVYDEYEQKISFNKIGAPAPKANADTNPPKFKKIDDLEIVFGPPTENADKVLELNGMIRNGKKNPVKDITIHFSFLNAAGKEFLTADRTLSSTLKPGEEKEFPVFIEKAPGAANFTFSYKFIELGEPKDDAKPEK